VYQGWGCNDRGVQPQYLICKKRFFGTVAVLMCLRLVGVSLVVLDHGSAHPAARGRFWRFLASISNC
jgi:hypothetical protein